MIHPANDNLPNGYRRRVAFDDLVEYITEVAVKEDWSPEKYVACLTKTLFGDGDDNT